MKKLSPILFSILILFFTEQSHSQEKVIYGWPRVIDGDSISINKESIRLHGIDAPEIKQICKKKNNTPYMCGVIAKDTLKNFIERESSGITRKKVYCYYSERDRYKRIIGKCYVGKDSEFNLNHAMVFTGQAVAYIKYSKDYIEAQNRAKKMGIGIWQGEFILPEEWRRKNK
tara:strand:- start:45 stop:560 length:516 start_codon:yes stop_codon:yes gene_type:complete